MVAQELIFAVVYDVVKFKQKFKKGTYHTSKRPVLREEVRVKGYYLSFNHDSEEEIEELLITSPRMKQKLLMGIFIWKVLRVKMTKECSR